MLLTISTTHRPATDLGYLLHKNPDRLQTLTTSFGKAHVFYPEANADRCTAVLLLDVDPVALVRGRGGSRLDPTLEARRQPRPPLPPPPGAGDEVWTRILERSGGDPGGIIEEASAEEGLLLATLTLEPLSRLPTVQRGPYGGWH